MVAKRRLGTILLVAAILASCSIPPTSPSINFGSQKAAPSQTPFFPDNYIPTSLSGTATATGIPEETSSVKPTSTSTPSMQVNLMAVGDIMLARSIESQALAHGPEIVFAGVQSVLDSADILVGNLECVLTNGTEHQTKSFTFAAAPGMAKALELAGFDVLNQANNHAMDFGTQGLFDTRSNLGQYGIAVTGAGGNFEEAHTPVFLKMNGLRLAFLGYMDVPDENTGFDARIWTATASQPGIAWADPAQIISDVAAARRMADVVVVMLHSGYENRTVISSSQRTAAYAAIDAGAALVIGSHSHILQTIEKYHGGLIAFSLGNFVFDNYLGISNASIILRVVLSQQGIQGFDYIPVLIKNGLPVITSIDNARGIETLVAP